MKWYWLGWLLGMAGDAALIGLFIYLTEPHVVAREVGDLIERHRQACDDDHHRRAALCSETIATLEISACELSSYVLRAQCVTTAENR